MKQVHLDVETSTFGGEETQSSKLCSCSTYIIIQANTLCIKYVWEDSGYDSFPILQ